MTTHQPAPAASHPHQVCLSCGAVLHGEFCHECGQKDIDLDRSLGALVADALSEAFEADGRLPRSVLPFLLQPGVMVRSWLMGRRRQWTSPVRVYVFALFAAFVVFGWAGGRSIADVPDTPLTEVEADADGNRVMQLGESELNMRLDVGDESRDDTLGDGFLQLEDMSQREIAVLLIEGLLRWTPRLVTLLVPILAGLLQLVYWRRRFLDHVVFSLDQHSRGLLLTAVAVGVGHPVVSNLFALVLLIHLVVGMRVVYGHSWAGTIGRWLLLVVGYGTVLFAGMIVIVLLLFSGL